MDLGLWEKRYAALKIFHRKHGHTGATKSNGGDIQLQHWVADERRRERDGKMSSEHYKKLDKLGFDWNTGSHWDRKWQEWYSMLKDFKERHGHMNIPRKDVSLQSWIGTQRRQLRRGTIEQERFALLNELGFDWNSSFMTSTFDVQWYRQYIELRKCHKERGHTNGNATDNMRLKRWIGTQRRTKREGTITKERQELLEMLDFEWIGNSQNIDIDIDSLWNKQYLALKTFSLCHGHTMVSKTNDDKVLARWVVEQRRLRREGTMDQERVDLLERLDFAWHCDQKRWEERYSQLQKFRKEFGTTRVTPSDDKPLSLWVKRQRGIKRSGKMDPSRYAKLEKLQFQWNIKNGPVECQSVPYDYECSSDSDSSDDHNNVTNETHKNVPWVVTINCSKSKWETQFKKAQAFKKKYGHLQIFSETDDKILASWCQLQRDVYSCGEMEPEHFMRLTSIQFTFYSKTENTGCIGPVECLDQCVAVGGNKMKEKEQSRLFVDMPIDAGSDSYADDDDGGGGKMPACSTFEKPTPVTPVAYIGRGKNADECVGSTRTPKRRKTAAACARVSRIEMDSDDDVQRPAKSPRINAIDDGGGKLPARTVADGDDKLPDRCSRVPSIRSTPPSSSEADLLLDRANDNARNDRGSVVGDDTVVNDCMDEQINTVPESIDRDVCNKRETLFIPGGFSLSDIDNAADDDESVEGVGECKFAGRCSIVPLIRNTPTGSCEEVLLPVDANDTTCDDGGKRSPTLSQCMDVDGLDNDHVNGDSMLAPLGQVIGENKMNVTLNDVIDEKRRERVSSLDDTLTDSMNDNAIVDTPAVESVVVELKGENQTNADGKDVIDEKPKERDHAISETVTERMDGNAIFDEPAVEPVTVDLNGDSCVAKIASPASLGQVVHENQMNAAGIGVIDEKSKERDNRIGATLTEETNDNTGLDKLKEATVVESNDGDCCAAGAAPAPLEQVVDKDQVLVTVNDKIDEKPNEKDSTIGADLAESMNDSSMLDEPKEAKTIKSKDGECGAASVSPAPLEQVVGENQLNASGNDIRDEKANEKDSATGSPIEKMNDNNVLDEAVESAMTKLTAPQSPALLQQVGCKDKVNSTGNGVMNEKPKEMDSTIGDSLPESMNDRTVLHTLVEAVMSKLDDGDCGAATSLPTRLVKVVGNDRLNASGNVNIDEKQKEKVNK